MTKPARLLSFAAAALLAACGSDSSVSPSKATPVDLATAFNEMRVPGIAAVGSLTGGVALPTANALPTGCTYASATQFFLCPAVTSSGITVTSSYALLDASGHSMTQFDASSVASLRVKSSIAGTLATGSDALTIDGQQDQTLSGLQSSTHTLNGTSTLNMSGTTSNTPITIRSTTTITNLVLPANGAANAYPVSGTVAVDQASTIAGGISISARVVMTFNGTSKVGVALSVDGQTLPGCIIDLAKAAPTCG